MAVVRADGKVLTPEALDELAKEYEDGTWENDLGPIRTGRPSLSKEELKSVSFKLPLSEALALEHLAETRGETKSELLRGMVKEVVGI